MSDMEKRQAGAQAALHAKTRMQFAHKHNLVLKRRVHDENGTMEMYLMQKPMKWPVVIAIDPSGLWGVYVCASMSGSLKDQGDAMYNLISMAILADKRIV
jgi:hypothetical protein